MIPIDNFGSGQGESTDELKAEIQKYQDEINQVEVECAGVQKQCIDQIANSLSEVDGKLDKSGKFHKRNTYNVNVFTNNASKPGIP